MKRSLILSALGAVAAVAVAVSGCGATSSVTGGDALAKAAANTNGRLADAQDGHPGGPVRLRHEGGHHAAAGQPGLRHHQPPANQVFDITSQTSNAIKSSGLGG